MTKTMLIDAAHPEETRVVVADGQRIDELDFEIQSRKQLRGNIYLAKITRVEPSLQAAFVEYGGNRHGFLAFNEIHPDYYQIPVADREALLREEAEEEHEPHAGRRGAKDAESEESSLGDDDDDIMEEELERRRRRLMRRYKIQEVVKRRQIMLVQVVKEERGNKGAALTTYLSLAGRYCVLMPNTARGGGISRKITNATDRKRLKSAVQGLDVPQGMGLIIRTAGAARTKAEIKRDYEYLLRLWENIRETTLKSIAPALIYEEEDLVKRAIRDMYDKDIDAVLVEGEAGYREARDFMRMLMPSQAKKVQQHREPTPLFVKYRVEDQLQQIHSPVVPLRSGGYLVINQTEALVAIDVNSGKSTRERNIEATALKTNMEAAEEAARQLRLRDLAGLIVIDFIDMDEGKNNRAVEKKLKDCLKDDRARLQMGKISPFGLMEISRQRRRIGVLEGATHVCEHCQGTGRVRSVESSALSALRSIEMEGVRGGPGSVLVRLPTPVALYVLNEKRGYIGRIEHTHGLTVTIATEEALSHAEIEIERTSHEEGRERLPEAPAYAPVSPIEDLSPVEEDEVLEEAVAEENEAAEAALDGEGRRKRRRRRRGRREGGPEQARTDGEALHAADTSEADEAGEEEDDEAHVESESESEAGARRRRRRRGRRGGRRMREEGRPQDAYGWVEAQGEEPYTPGADPYVWRDRHELASPANIPSTEAVAAEAPEPQPEIAPASADADSGVYAWRDGEAGTEAGSAEAAKPEPRSRRVRSGRGRGRTRVDVDAEAVAPAPEAEEPAAAEPDPAEAEAPAPERPAPELVVANPPAAPPEPSPAPAAAQAPAPSPVEPDPAEVSGQPPAPKRGWWRRRG